MEQQAPAEFERCAKTTRRARFLADMREIVPWAELATVIEPFYPKISATGGRPPLPLEWMLRAYFLQLWFNLPDLAVEEALYESMSMRYFVGIDLEVDAAPDETTVCRFRQLLGRNDLGRKLLLTVNERLRRSGIMIATGTIVDATIIGARSSRKGCDGKGGLESHRTAKGSNASA
jgi:IS5 family transposase